MNKSSQRDKNTSRNIVKNVTMFEFYNQFGVNNEN